MYKNGFLDTDKTYGQRLFKPLKGTLENISLKSLF